MAQPAKTQTPPAPKPGIVRRALSEPLLHFLAIGAALFAWYGMIGEPVASPSGKPQIVITQADLDRLSERFQAIWRRPPAEDERDALLQDFLREEVYYREALGLGLDRGDAVIRQRLRQKMEFISNAGAAALEPEPDQLAEFYHENSARFTPAPTLTFQQIFLGETPEDGTVTEILAALQSDAEPSTLGESTLLPPRVENSPAVAVDGTFGTGFFRDLTAGGQGGWIGPIRSAYGLHLVLVEQITVPPAPDLAEIRDRVLAEWQRREAIRLNEAQFEQLLARYDLILPGDDGPAQ